MYGGCDHYLFRRCVSEGEWTSLLNAVCVCVFICVFRCVYMCVHVFMCVFMFQEMTRCWNKQ